MITMNILMDEDKIKKESQYTIKEIYKKITNIIVSKGIKPNTEDGIYQGTDSKDDFANFGRAILELKDCKWFTQYVKTWTWNVDGENDNIAQFYKLGDAI